MDEETILLEKITRLEDELSYLYHRLYELSGLTTQTPRPLDLLTVEEMQQIAAHYTVENIEEGRFAPQETFDVAPSVLAEQFGCRVEDIYTIVRTKPYLKPNGQNSYLDGQVFFDNPIEYRHWLHLLFDDIQADKPREDDGTKNELGKRIGPGLLPVDEIPHALERAEYRDMRTYLIQQYGFIPWYYRDEELDYARALGEEPHPIGDTDDDK